jgi:hypothetical protein
MRAAAGDCAAAGDAVDGGCAAADAPPHAATAQAPASALAVRNVFLIMLPSMRRPASGRLSGSLIGTVTFEAIDVNEKDMKLARLGRQTMSTAPAGAFLHVAVMVFPYSALRESGGP